MPFSKFSHVKVSAISAVVPENFINIDDEIKFYKNDTALLERNKKILGLGKRHVADERTSNTDLCEAAALDLIEKLNLSKDKIDAVIVASTSHDYHYPATACVLQGRLGLSEECTCFDVAGLACSAYVHGLMLGHSLVESGTAKCCLVVAGDITSRHSDRRNRNSNMLFGDAGTATLLEYTDETKNAYFYTGTRGKDWDKLVAPAGGYDIPVKADIADLEIIDDTGNVWHLWDDIMKGMDVFKFATTVGPQGIAKILEYANTSIDDIDYFAFHQANKQIVKNIALYAKVPKDKFSFETFAQFGNCGSAAVTMDIARKFNEQHVDKLCLATFGVGLSWGFSVLDTKETKVLPIKLYKTPDDKMTREQKIEHWVSYYKAN